MTTHLIDSYFAAMRRGAVAEAELLALFADDVGYSEPFSGDGPAVGIDAVRARFRAGWELPLPELELDVLSIDIDGPEATADWECRSPALPGPMRGRDRYEIRDGKITRLEVQFVE